jgi:hypothetical protein
MPKKSVEKSAGAAREPPEVEPPCTELSLAKPLNRVPRLHKMLRRGRSYASRFGASSGFGPKLLGDKFTARRVI